MEKLTYQQAYKMIIDAYFKDEIKPMDGSYCFCGTLCGNNKDWMSDGGTPLYKKNALKKMEKALLKPLMELGVTRGEGGGVGNWFNFTGLLEGERFEELLFEGMSDALEVLKEIHRSRGEDVDTYVPEKQFIKRELIKN